MIGQRRGYGSTPAKLLMAAFRSGWPKLATKRRWQEELGPQRRRESQRVRLAFFSLGRFRRLPVALTLQNVLQGVTCCVLFLLLLLYSTLSSPFDTSLSPSFLPPSFSFLSFLSSFFPLSAPVSSPFQSSYFSMSSMCVVHIFCAHAGMKLEAG